MITSTAEPRTALEKPESPVLHPSNRDLRIALIHDFTEENWPSMDLCGDQLAQHLHRDHENTIRSRSIRPAYVKLATRIPSMGDRKFVKNVDRMLNRWWTYPRHLRRIGDHFNAFHICDHSYAHLVHSLPASRAGVCCCDLDAFRCLMHPEIERRPRWFRAMMARVLDGLRHAAVVFCISRHTKRQLESYRLVDPKRLVHAPLGVASEFRHVPDQDDERIIELLPAGRGPSILHVGSCIPRKRIDVLLATLAKVRQRLECSLIQVGGSWTSRQRRQLKELGLECCVTQLRGISRRQLAALYRQASLVMQPSESEGFGLPVVEALACGGIVVASNIDSLREAGGTAAVYCDVGDVDSWAETVVHLLQTPTSAPNRQRRTEHARTFSWSNHADIIRASYEDLI